MVTVFTLILPINQAKLYIIPIYPWIIKENIFALVLTCITIIIIIVYFKSFYFIYIYILIVHHIHNISYHDVISD